MDKLDKTNGTATKEKLPGNGKSGTLESQKQTEAKEKSEKAKKEAYEKDKKEVAERRERIKRTADAALTLVSEQLQKNNLPPAVKATYQWVRDSALNAKKQSLDVHRDTYTVNIVDNKNKIIESRQEGMPVDELYGILLEDEERLNQDLAEIKKLQRSHQESKLARERYNINKPTEENEYEVKLAWYKSYQELQKDSPLKQEIEAQVQEWENRDRENAQSQGKEFSGYTGEQRNLQLGEAVRQLVIKHLDKPEAELKASSDLNEKDQKYLRHLQKYLSGESSSYYNFHYKKGSKELTKEERTKQALYTERETSLISSDSTYREVLLRRYKAVKMLPKNFDRLDQHSQNFRLATLALQHRRVLKMPQVTAEAPEPVTAVAVPKEVDPSVGTVNPVVENVPEEVFSAPQPVEQAAQEPVESAGLKEHMLQNTNEFYDLENQNFRIPNLQNTNEPYDLENQAFLIPKKEVPPTGPEKNTIYLIDVSEIARRMAREKADERLTQEFKDAGFFKRAFKGVSENSKRIQYFQESLAEIQKDNNLMRAIRDRASGVSSQGRIEGSGDYYKILNSVVSQYKGEIADVQKEIGEKIEDSNVSKEIKDKIAQMIDFHTRGKWEGEYARLKGRDALELFVKNEIIPLFKDRSWSNDVDRKKEARGELFASNFYEIAEQYKQYLEGESKKVLQELGPENEKAIQEHIKGMLHLDVQLGLKERDLMNNKPQGVLLSYEKLADRFENIPILKGIVTNPLVAGALISGGGSFGARKLAKMGLMSAAAAAGIAGVWVPIAAGAFVGAGIKFMKRSKDIKYDIAQEQRYETLGGKGSEILDKKGGLRYDTITFEDALTSVKALEGKNNLTDAEKQQLAMVIARLQMEPIKKVDLFTLSEEEGEKFNTTEVAKTQLRLAIKAIEKATGLDEKALEQFTMPERQALIQMMETAEKKQESFRKIEAWKSAATGALMGLAGGALSHWATEYFHDAAEQVKASIGAGAAHAREALKGNIDSEHAAFLIHRPSMTPEEWHKKLGVTKIFHKDWHHDHALETPDQTAAGNHIFSGKELQGRLLHNAENDKVTFSFSKALQNIKDNINKFGDPEHPLGENTDGTVDSRFAHLLDGMKGFKNKFPEMSDEEIQQHLNSYANKIHENIVVRIIPTDAMNKAGEGIVVGHLDKAGNIIFNDDLRHLAFDKSGKQIAKFLEVGYQDQQGGFNTLATSVGAGEGYIPPIPEEIVSGASIINHDNLNIAKPLTNISSELPHREGYGIATVLPERKIYERPEDRAKAEKARKEKAEKQAREEAKKTEQQRARDLVIQKEREKERAKQEKISREKEIREQNKDAFDKEKVRASVGVYQRYLTKEQKAEAGVNTKLIKSFWDAEAKAGENVIHESGPSTREYLEEITKLNKSAEQIQYNFERVQDIDKRIKAILVDKKPIDLDDDLHDLKDEFKKLRGKAWNKDFKIEEYRKEREDALEPENEPEPTSNDPSDNDPTPGKKRPTKNSQELKNTQEEKSLEKAIEAFKAKHKNVSLEIGENWPVSFKAKEKVVKNLEKAFDELSTDKDIKIGKIKVVLKAKGGPSIGDSVWELSKNVKSEQIKKVLGQKKNPNDEAPDLEKDGSDLSLERKAAFLALERVKKWKTLDPKNPANRDRNFLLALRNIKKEFAVESKKFRKKNIRDLDASSSLQLFRLAKINVEKVIPIHSGGFKKDTVHLDTGNKEGFVVTYHGMEKGEPYTGQPLTVYFDHHAAESKRGTSTTKYVYETLRKLELLPEDPSLEKAVEFITQQDNRSYPSEEKYYKDSPYTLLGVGRYISFEKLYQFFKDGLSPIQKLSEEQLQKYDLVDASEIQKKVLENTEPMYKELEKNGFVVDSGKDKYGKILVDIGAKFNSKAGGFVGAKAMGADTYIIWNPKTQSFMMSTTGRSFSEKLLPQGRRLRETMWIKDEPGSLRVNLLEVLQTLNERGFRMGPKMREALKEAETQAKRGRAVKKAA